MTDPQPCPGVCNAAWRATGEGDPRPGDPVWCAMDAARIRRLLAELDDLAALLEYQINGHHPPATSPAGAGGDDPSPSPSGDDIDELERFLLDWDDAYRDWHNGRYPDDRWPSRVRRGVLATITTSTVAWLTRHLDGILASDLAEDFGAEVAQRHREFVGKTRAGTGRRLGKVPCPRCGYLGLVSEDGTDYWACGHCGRRLSRPDYDELVSEAAARHLERAG